MTETRRRGRPRSTQVDQAILSAAFELLAEEGFAGMSMEGVAHRAGVGKDTLYRRWSSKTDLVRDALVRMTSEAVPVPDTGSFESDVETYTVQLVRLLTRTPLGRVLASLVSESARNPELGQAFREFNYARRETAKQVADRPSRSRAKRIAIDEELYLDLLLGALLYRHLITGAPLNERYARDVATAMTLAFAPARSGSRASETLGEKDVHFHASPNHEGEGER